MKEYLFNEIDIGLEESFTKKITLNMEKIFREISNDDNPMHYDDEFAKNISNGKLKSHISYGMLTASLLSTLAGVYLPGKYSLIHSISDIKFKNPVYVNDTVKVVGTVIEKIDGLNLIVIKIKMTNQDNKVVLEAKMKNVVQK